MDGLTTDTRTAESADDGDAFTRRARYYSPANIFKLKRAPIRQHVFLAERDRAMAPDAPTGWITLDIGEAIAIPSPATTPLMLARYAAIRPGETLTGEFAASGEFYFVIAGAGRVEKADEAFDFAPADIFALPGGGETRLTAGPDGAVLFQVTNEPELAFHGLAAPGPADAPTQAARYPMAEIQRQMDLARAAQAADPDASGRALHLTSEKLDAQQAIHPTIKLAVNSLDAHSVQRPHRHNSVALTLPIQAEGVYSVIEGNRHDWHPYALMITPPAERHEHRNEGDDMMLSLVVQDGGLYFHCRTIGFSFD
jgi:gentisate 1,2-dioxygenase